MFLALLDLIYPPRCACCRTLVENPTSSFCALCAVTLLPREAACRRCGEPWSGGGTAPAECGRCLSAPPPVAVSWWAFEHGGSIRNAIAQLKYSGRTELARPLTREFGPIDDTRWDLVVPVPLHPQRRRRRGYNQSALLARQVGRTLGVPTRCRALRRTRPTRSQVGLSQAQRQDNVRGAFQLRQPRAVAGKNVLLVDDVVTTGATTHACARALRRGGARRIGVWSVARGI